MFIYIITSYIYIIKIFKDKALRFHLKKKTIKRDKIEKIKKIVNNEIFIEKNHLNRLIHKIYIYLKNAKS